MDEHLPEPIRAVEHELTALLRRGRAVSWEIAREVHPNLEPNTYGLLLWLRRVGSIRLTELAARLGVGKGTLSRQINALEVLGLVHRDPDPSDRRAAQISLTEEGSAGSTRPGRPGWASSCARWTTGRSGTSRSSPGCSAGSTTPGSTPGEHGIAPRSVKLLLQATKAYGCLRQLSGGPCVPAPPFHLDSARRQQR